jgi:uncharacterized protein (TIGR00375 family)
MKEMERIDDGTFELDGIRFIPTVEVEDMMRVHHLLIFPSVSSVEDAIERLTKRGENLGIDKVGTRVDENGRTRDVIDYTGRPQLRMTGDEIAELAQDVDALIGPCHAFTPWTAIYSAHDDLKGCYGDMAHTISFVELGLSAETSYADRIDELRRLTYLTNSDAHGPSPHRVAREFNRFEVEDNTAEEIRKAILRQGGRKPILNVGLPSQEGKYNETACVNKSCHLHVPYSDAHRNRMKCASCGKTVKIGVRDRVDQLATREDSTPPSHRPPYVPLIPLAEIISRAIGKGVNTKGVQTIWESLIAEFGTEIKVLVDVPVEELEGHSEDIVIRSIRAFREGEVRFIPGGGGKYGEIRLPWEDGGLQAKAPVQKGLVDFF